MSSKLLLWLEACTAAHTGMVKQRAIASAHCSLLTLCKVLLPFRSELERGFHRYGLGIKPVLSVTRDEVSG